MFKKVKCVCPEVGLTLDAENFTSYSHPVIVKRDFCKDSCLIRCFNVVYSETHNRWDTISTSFQFIKVVNLINNQPVKSLEVPEIYISYKVPQSYFFRVQINYFDKSALPIKVEIYPTHNTDIFFCTRSFSNREKENLFLNIRFNRAFSIAKYKGHFSGEKNSIKGTVYR